MNRKTVLITLSFIVILFIQSCNDDSNDVSNIQNGNQEVDTSSPVPEFYLNDKMNSPDFIVAAGIAQLVREPQDIDFHPTRENELWILNRGNENTGGSTVLLFDAGSEKQTHKYLKDGNAWHFLSIPTAMEFGENENWASGTGILDANHSGGHYTGPTLWSSDLDIYAVVGNPPVPGINGSHLDMVHQSPYCMGIAHEIDNVYWVFDGYHGNLIRYDFVLPHYPGGHDHSDARLRRHSDVQVLKSPDHLPSHMILDKKTGWLYVAETSKSRILRFNINSGEFNQYLTPDHGEPLAEYSDYKNSEWEVFTSNNLKKPVGIDIFDNRLFVSDYETGEIIAYNITNAEEIGRINTENKGIMGIKVNKDGKLWYVNALRHEVAWIKTK